MRLRGLILAGGNATRFGGRDKALLPLGDKSLLAHVLARLGSQVDAIALSTNAPPARYADYGIEVLADRLRNVGPLAGVHAAATMWPDEALVSVAVDQPFLPLDAVARLRRAWDGVRCRHAAVDGRHMLVVLWPPGMGERLTRFLGQERSLYAWLTLHSDPIAFDGLDGFDLNVNINTAADLRAAARYLNGEEAPAQPALD